MNDPETRLDMVKSLLHHTQRGFIDIGDLGEMVSPIILLLAFDKAHGLGRPWPITVADFFKALFPKHVHQEIARRCQRNASILQVWEGSVFLSHFARTQSEDRRVTAGTLRRAYARNAALVVPNNFEGCDLIVPILLSQPRKMSYVLIQVKNVKNKNLTRRSKGKALEDLTPHSNLVDPKCPLFRIYLSLQGAKRSSFSSPESAAEVVADDSPRRVIVAAAGLDDALYPALKESSNPGNSRVAEMMKSLLACTDHINVAERSRHLEAMYPFDTAEEY